MIRLLLSLIFIVLVAIGGMYLAYGTAYPCAALEVERGERPEVQTGPQAGRLIRHLTDKSSNMGECASALVNSWGDRLSELIHR
jgi:hypothetical protein